MTTTNTEPQQIRSKYSDDQLRDALITATELRERIFIRGTVGADGAYGSQHWSEDQIADLHAILNVLETADDIEGADAGEDLGEPTRVWEEAKDIQNVRRGDEIRIETKGFVGYYSSPVAKVNLVNGWLHFQNGDYYAWDDRDHVSRIPAPVPPLPEDTGAVIADATFETDEGTQTALLLVRSKYGSWTGVTTEGIEWGSISDDQISSWSPAVLTIGEHDG